MNRILEAYARQWLKDQLALCTEAQQQLFMRMYASKTQKSINDVIASMPVDALDWAMIQVMNTRKHIHG